MTAVQWLVKKLSYETSDGTIISHHFIINKLVEQAKKMEKEQIIESVVNTVKIGTEKEGVLLFTSEDEILIRNESEQYYNVTFKSE